MEKEKHSYFKNCQVEIPLYAFKGKFYLTLCMLGNFACFFVVCGKKSFRNTIRVSNSLDPDQARRFVGPDMGLNCWQRLSADDKSRH